MLCALCRGKQIDLNSRGRQRHWTREAFDVTTIFLALLFLAVLRFETAWDHPHIYDARVLTTERTESERFLRMG